MGGKMNVLSFTLLIFWLGFEASVAAGQGIDRTETTRKSFYEDRERGYYSYEVYSQPGDQDTHALLERPDTLPEYSYDQLWNMPIKQLNRYVEDVTSKAVQTASKKDVERYLMVVDLARRKSLAFAGAVGLYGQLNPHYSISDVAPITIPGQKASVQMQHDEISRLISQARDEFGLVMFTRVNCSYCEAQRGILNYFFAKYHWPIKEIDIDESPDLPTRMGIETTPTIVIVEKETLASNFIHVGVLSLSDLEKRIYRTIKYMRGQIKPEQWAMYEYQKDSGADPLRFLKNSKDD